jgi:predicted nucleotidyltransferase
METLDLKPAHLEIVKRILAEYAPYSEVWAFGSRVSHTGHEGSDLDLVILDRTPSPHHSLSSLAAAFSESNLPILVDVLAWSRLPEFMRRQIEEAHMVLQSGR